MSEHRRALERVGVSGFSLEVSLVLGVSEQGMGEPRAEVDEVYALDGWEYVDLGAEAEEPAVDRLREALMAHAWAGLRLHGTSGEPRAHADADEEFSEFVEAPPADLPGAAEVDAEHARLGLGALDADGEPRLFDRLRCEMERVRALPAGAAKERQAALLALAVERALAP